jgi:transposase
MNSDHFIYGFSDGNFNTSVFKEFLVILVEMFEKMVLVIDAAPYHTSIEMQKFYRDNKDCLHIEYLPSYSPELNPTEMSWRETKKWLATRCWKDKEELKKEITTAFNEGISMIPIYDYLLP